MFSTDSIFKQHENLVEDPGCIHATMQKAYITYMFPNHQKNRLLFGDKDYNPFDRQRKISMAPHVKDMSINNFRNSFSFH